MKSLAMAESQEASKLASIPEEIIIEILLRLPVKSLLRFKLICKTWYDFIKDPNFKSMHQNCNTPSQLLMCRNVSFGDKQHCVFSFLSNDISTSTLSPDLEIQSTSRFVNCIVGTCNGIVCYYDYTTTIFLCNPATREFKQLPPSPFQEIRGSYDFKLGFGFDGPNNDFKVVRLFYVHSNNFKGFKGEIFTLSSNTWRPLDWVLEDSQYDPCPGLFCGDSLHWIVQGSEYPSRETIICCDMHTESYKRMDLPPHDDLVLKSSYLLVFKEFLTVAVRPLLQTEGNCLVIWIMKDYGDVESWTKLYTIRPSVYLTPICFWMNDHALLLSQIFRNDAKLVSCHLNPLDLERIGVEGLRRNSKLVVYKETLVSIM